MIHRFLVKLIWNRSPVIPAMFVQENCRSRLSPVSLHISFALLFAVSSLISWGTLRSTLAISLNHDEYTHIMLIFPNSAALMSLALGSHKLRPEPNLFIGSTVLGLALTIRFVGANWWGLQADVQLSMKVLALIIWWVGAFVLCFGTRSFRSFLFPLCFLFWLVPLPEFVLNGIVSLLQQGSAYMAHLLFLVAGVPVEKDEVVLSIPGLTIEVAKNCSSIRSSMILWVTTMVLAQLLLRLPWSKALLIGVSIPLAVAKNALRIFAIAMLTTRVDPAFMTGELHHDGGIVFFMFSLMAIFALLWILRRVEAHVPAEASLNPVRL
jgi:exosortase